MYLKITHGEHALRLPSPDGEPKRLFVKPGDIVIMRKDVAEFFLGQRPDCAEIIERPVPFLDERATWLGAWRYLARAEAELTRTCGARYLASCPTWQGLQLAFDQAFAAGRLGTLKDLLADLAAYLRRHAVVVPTVIISEEDIA